MSRSPRGNESPVSRSHGRSRSPTPHSPTSQSRERDPEEARNPGNQVYIGGLGPSTTKEDLEARFGKYGPFEECSVVTDPHRSECRGFGFVRYTNNLHAVEAVNCEHKSFMDGRALVVEFSKRNCARPKTPGMYLGQRSDMYSRHNDRSPDRRRHDRSPHGRYDSRSSRHDRYRNDQDDKYDRHRDANSDRRDRDRDRDRDHGRARVRDRDHHREKDYARDRDRERTHGRDRDRSRERSRDRDRRSNRYH